MPNSLRAEKVIAIPLLLVAALLALTGCVAPPPSYPAQSPPGTINTQGGYSTQPYTVPPENQPGYTSQQYQPQYQPQYFATFCSAGVYQCPVPGNTPVGASCACPGLGAPSYGVAR